MSEQLSLMQVPNCTLTETGASFDSGMDFKAWIDAGNRLCRAEACLNWWIGDWVNFGASKYGDRSRIARENAEAFGLSKDTIDKNAQVAREVPLRIRIRTLSWSHHRVVVEEGVDDMADWLQRAESNKWSVSDLRVQIREGRAEYRHADTKRMAAPFNPAEFAPKCIAWFENQPPIEQWDEGRRSVTKEFLRPLVEIYEKL